MPAPQTALLQHPNLVYSVDGATRDPAGESYFGRPEPLSLLPGEHAFVIVVPPGYHISGYDRVATRKIWYSVKATLQPAGTYGLRWQFSGGKRSVGCRGRKSTPARVRGLTGERGTGCYRA
jgi:hypothetical protein